jgi:hypothetical protein
LTWRGAATLPGMSSCCPSRDYLRFFNQRFARRLANRYRKRGLDPTAQTMVEFLRELGIEGASVLEVGGGVGEIEIELLQAGAARAQNLELSPAYQQEAHTLAGQAGVQGRLDWRLHDLAEDPGAVAPADRLVLHRVVCCYPDYQRRLAAAADHTRRALVFSYPPRKPAVPRLLWGVQPGDAADPQQLSGVCPAAECDACGAGGPRTPADVPAPQPHLADRWPQAGLVSFLRITSFVRPPRHPGGPGPRHSPASARPPFLGRRGARGARQARTLGFG